MWNRLTDENVPLDGQQVLAVMINKSNDHKLELIWLDGVFYDHIYHCFYVDGSFIIPGEGSFVPTHWMEIPALPKE